MPTEFLCFQLIQYCLSLGILRMKYPAAVYFDRFLLLFQSWWLGNPGITPAAELFHPRFRGIPASADGYAVHLNSQN
jgi:hypothetical protein